MKTDSFRIFVVRVHDLLNGENNFPFLLMEKIFAMTVLHLQLGNQRQLIHMLCSNVNRSTISMHRNAKAL